MSDTTTTTTHADIVSSLVCDMVDDRMFYRAAQSLDKYGHLLHTNALLAVIKAICDSYDIYQFNHVDEDRLFRREFVEKVALLVLASPDSFRFVEHPTTAIAFAFHRTTRRGFIELAVKHHQAKILQIIFGDMSIKFLCGTFGQGYNPLPAGLLSELNLLHIYWGCDLDDHVSVFLRHGAKPFLASWHRASEMELRHASLSLPQPDVPFLRTVANIVRTGKCDLSSSSVMVCGKFLDADPRCPVATSLSDALVVARHIGFDPWRHRTCSHFNMSGDRSGPVTDAELWLAIERARFALVWFPQLSSYVKLEIVDRLVKRVPDRVFALRMFDRLLDVVASITARHVAKKIKQL